MSEIKRENGGAEGEGMSLRSALKSLEDLEMDQLPVVSWQVRELDEYLQKAFKNLVQVYLRYLLGDSNDVEVGGRWNLRGVKVVLKGDGIVVEGLQSDQSTYTGVRLSGALEMRGAESVSSADEAYLRLVFTRSQAKQAYRVIFGVRSEAEGEEVFEREFQRIERMAKTSSDLWRKIKELRVRVTERKKRKPFQWPEIPVVEPVKVDPAVVERDRRDQAVLFELFGKVADLSKRAMAQLEQLTENAECALHDLIGPSKGAEGRWDLEDAVVTIVEGKVVIKGVNPRQATCEGVDIKDAVVAKGGEFLGENAKTGRLNFAFKGELLGEGEVDKKRN